MHRRGPSGIRAIQRWGTLLLSIAICLLLVTAARGSAPHVYWSTPVDIAYPNSDGRDVDGVLICDAYQNLHILWGKAYNGGSAIYYRTDEAGELSFPTDVIAISERQAL